MSLDIYLIGKEKLSACRCSECGLNHSRAERETLYEANITHNLAKMATEAEIYKVLWRPEEIGAKTAHDIIGMLGLGLDLLKKNPDHYKKFNASNGWGKYEHLVEFVEKYLDACIEHQDATIEVSR